MPNFFCFILSMFKKYEVNKVWTGIWKFYQNVSRQFIFWSWYGRRILLVRHIWNLCFFNLANFCQTLSIFLNLCVCVWDRERERESVWVYLRTATSKVIPIKVEEMVGQWSNKDNTHTHIHIHTHTSLTHYQGERW